jgi:DNA polymerase delta subunit 1
MESKGASSVRRSNTIFHRSLFIDLQALFLERNGTKEVDEALYSLVKERLQRVVDGDITVAEFSRTCKLKEHYDTPQSQSVVRDKIKQRAPGSEPMTGDRVKFAMMRTSDPKLPAYQMAECSAYMEQNNIPLATHYYIRSMKNSIVQLFQLACLDVVRAKKIFDDAERIAIMQMHGQSSISFTQSLSELTKNMGLKLVSQPTKSEPKSAPAKLQNTKQQSLRDFFLAM